MIYITKRALEEDESETTKSWNYRKNKLSRDDDLIVEQYRKAVKRDWGIE
jgi:hypothetical protein